MYPSTHLSVCVCDVFIVLYSLYISYIIKKKKNCGQYNSFPGVHGDVEIEC